MTLAINSCIMLDNAIIPLDELTGIVRKANILQGEEKWNY